LNMSGESRQPSLIPDFKGYGFSFSPFSRMLALGLQCIPYVVLRIIPSIHSFFRVFIIKVCWILSKAFSALIERIRWFLSCLQFVCCITLIFISWTILTYLIETELVMVNYLFGVLLNSDCQHLVENSCIYVHYRYLSMILFSC
jgi:hypothetical protein